MAQRDEAVVAASADRESAAFPPLGGARTSITSTPPVHILAERFRCTQRVSGTSRPA